MLPYVKISLSLILLTSLAKSQLINLDRDGNVGVNFGGYKASAGLGGLLTGDLAKGGLHAEAGTPHGQAAAAGLGGNIEDDGTSRGGLYAGATAGGDVGAGAGLSGVVTRTGSAGIATAGASADSDNVFKTQQSIHTEDNIQKISPHSAHVEKTVTKTLTQAPVQTETQLHVTDQAYQPIPETVFFQKTRLRRPHLHRKQLYFNAGYNAGAGYPPEVNPELSQKVKIVEKTYAPVQPAPVIVQKYVAPAPPSGGFLTKLVAAGTVDANPSTIESRNSGNVYTKSATFNRNGNLFNDIFNIPISTLAAVNQLLNNIAGGTSVSVSKHATVNAAVAKDKEIVF